MAHRIKPCVMDGKTEGPSIWCNEAYCCGNCWKRAVIIGIEDFAPNHGPLDKEMVQRRQEYAASH